MLLKIGIIVMVVLLGYFFSYQLQRAILLGYQKIARRIGISSKNKELSIQRYIFLHRKSLVSKIYHSFNEQIINLGLKRAGVTPVGYLFFWLIINAIITLVIWFVLGITFLRVMILYVVLFVTLMIGIRIYIASRMEKHEEDVMSAIDLIVPDISGGVQNAIIRYMNNYAPSIRPDFQAFVANLERGVAFADAVYMLSDSLGSVFPDFAEKAIYYEQMGENDGVEIFTVLIETNHVRRTLRHENNIVFSSLKVSFLVSAGMTVMYAIFILTTDTFSRHFFLETNVGNILLLLMMFIVVAVMGYLTVIKSDDI